MCAKEVKRGWNIIFRPLEAWAGRQKEGDLNFGPAGRVGRQAKRKLRGRGLNFCIFSEWAGRQGRGISRRKKG